MVEYKKATENDGENIAKVLVKSFNIASIEEGIEIFKRESQKDNFIIAEEDGKILGLISWDMHGLPKHQLIRIERIAVIQNEKLKELGEGLFRKAMEDADKYYKSMKLKLRKVYAMVHSSNKGLKDFYEDLGFMVEARLKDHFYNGVDEYLLSIFFE